MQNLGLVGGPLLGCVAAALLPDSYLGAGEERLAFSAAGHVTAAVAVWMAVWWFSEAISVYATALLPLALLPILGARSMPEAAAPYAHDIIFLFMGGFLIALAMQRFGLHRRIALACLRLSGDRPSSMVGGFMAVTALLSMWVSNTATAVMMLPVALSLVDLVARQVGGGDGRAAFADPAAPIHNLALALLLGIAYAASIGGMATPIGTPPNALLLAYVESHLGLTISFARWTALMLPFVVVFLVLAWLLLTRVLYPVGLKRIAGADEMVRTALLALGPMTSPERIVLGVFCGTASLWITRPLLADVAVLGHRPFAGLTDAGIAMLAALALFVAPAGRRPLRFILDWDTAVKLPWGILVLFGGGLSLAAAIQANGVGEMLGGQVAAFAGIPPLLILVVVVTGITFLTELTSNTATTATLVPVLAAVAPGLGVEPLLLIVPAALAASCAFMLPVATPPNAVVFGSGLIGISEMSRAGFWLNWVGIALITLFATSVLIPVLSNG